MIFKYAFRNLIRLPWKTMLYIGAVFLMICAIVASLFVFVACNHAVNTLNENYVFVASLVKKQDGILYVSDLGKCLEGNDVLAFNITTADAESAIPGGDIMFEYPQYANGDEPPLFWTEDQGCRLLAVENLSLEYAFFSGDCKIREGTGLTAEGYSGQKDELVIPWWLADEYDISVGDVIVRRYEAEGTSLYLKGEVVGIYETEASVYEKTAYPAYMPLASAEIDYKYLYGSAPSKTVTIERADFILNRREAFDDFVLQAEKNGLDFKKSDIVFNNSTYDVLYAELMNIRMITLLVCVIVLFVGVGVLVFLTAYLWNSKKQERMLLSMLGMKKTWINIVFITELSVMLLIASFTGFGAGKLSADFVCYSVNHTVLARASASEAIQQITLPWDFDKTMPLERDVDIQISTEKTEMIMTDVEMNENVFPAEDEIGISKHTFQVIGASNNGLFFDYAERAWTPSDFIGVTDFSEFELSIQYDDIPTLSTYKDWLTYVYVSENSPYADAIGSELWFNECPKNSVVKMRYSSGKAAFSERYIPKQSYVIIVGTYKENAICSENDVLLAMNEYHLLFREYSITDENFYFERIDMIVKKEDFGNGGT